MLQAYSSGATSMEPSMDIPQPGITTTEEARAVDEEVCLLNTAYV